MATSPPKSAHPGRPQPLGIASGSTGAARLVGRQAALSLTDFPIVNEAISPFPVVPGYRVVRELGRGGMGVVYEGLDVRLNRPVALKVMAADIQANVEYRARLRDEAEAVARLQHPNVVHIYQVGECSAGPFLALELIRGGSLSDALAVAPLATADAVNVVRTVARAVQHAHDRGVIHRDLKPANVLLGDAAQDSVSDGDGATLAAASPVALPSFQSPKVTDFGLAILADRMTGRTQTGVFVGTPCYVAPEIVDRPRSASPASDVYALGVMLYECLTGQVPFKGDSLLDVLRQIREDEPVSLRLHRYDLHRDLDAVCRKALAKKPEARYPTAGALADDLDRYAAGRRVWAKPSHRARGLRRICRWALAGAAMAVGLYAADLAGRYSDGLDAVRGGRDLMGRGSYAEAEAAAARGLQAASSLPLRLGPDEELARLRRAAHRGRTSLELHRLVDRLRFGFDSDDLPRAEMVKLCAACDELWAAKDEFAAVEGFPLDGGAEVRLRTDLLDLALLSAEFRVRGGGAAERGAAADRLAEAARLFGPSALLDHMRDAVRFDAEPRSVGDEKASPWELFALGRFRLHRGDAAGAAPLLRRAVDAEPTAFWPNFYAALAAHRLGHSDEAVGGFTVCLTVAHDRRGLLHYDRALAHLALGNREAAFRDLDRALALEPTLAEAAYRRGALHRDAGRIAEATIDLESALRNGYAPAEAQYRLALVRRDARDFAAAAAGAAETLRLDPAHEGARALLAELRTTRTPNE